MRHHRALAVDLGWVALSPFLALLIRDNFVAYPPHLEAITTYAAIAVAASTIVFLIAGSHKTLWQYTALPDVLRILAIVTVALLLALFTSFLASRLDGVARSVPVIQWFLLVGAMVGTRVGARIWHEHARRARLVRADASAQQVLIVGVSHLTELYLQAVAEYGSSTVQVVGLLSDRRKILGRLLRQQEILGTPEELPQIIAQLEVHGVTIERIAVMQPFEQFSRGAASALLAVEQGSGVKVDWMVERLGLTETRVRKDDRAPNPLPDPHARLAPVAWQVAHPPLGKYGYWKRAFDILLVLFLAVVLAPLILVIGLLVGLDVGFPLVFWQQRPGRFGRPFKLFKFCTMRPAHDEQGNRVPDELRSSNVGRLLRRTRLDELPQLYNILIGEMSFVGPRPLLPVDQPEDMTSRLFVRPGLTGFAQVNGGRDISVEDKNALDMWYIRNASPLLDIHILLRTSAVLIRGERVDHNTLLAVRQGLMRQKTRGSASPGSYSLISKSVVGDRGVEIVQPVG